jgi:mono/diheme cytochrome c family protein
VTVVLSTLSPAQTQNPRQLREKVNQLSTELRTAGALFADGKMDASADLVKKVQKELETLVAQGIPSQTQRSAKQIYTKLANAHSLLELEAIELDPLPDWEELIKPKAMTTGVSFRDSIAPWLVSRCGNCHIDNKRGQFSLETFADLRRGTPAGVVLFPGASRGSRLVEVLETGDMPRGGGQLSTAQIEELKKWIDEGAKLDEGLQPNQPLQEYVVSIRGAGNTNINVSRASGKETVSFASDVAPILFENCNGCHIGGQRASGNLRMDTFGGLLRGGDSGNVLEAGNAAASLILARVKGEQGARMPAGGRPALNAKQIETLQTWIQEGAKFDGTTPQATLADDARRAWANSASVDELRERKHQDAMAAWKRVSPDSEVQSASSRDFLVLGDVQQTVVDEALDAFTVGLKDAQKEMSIPDEFVPGGIAVFVTKSRYQYGELGQMLENRELPANWQTHFRTDKLLTYVAVVADGGWNDDTRSELAYQSVIAAYLGSFPEVPYWFAEGIARAAVLKKYRRASDRAKFWQQAAPRAFSALKNSDQLLQGQVNEESQALIGMGLGNIFLNRSNSKRFDKLLEQLHDGQSFPTAMRASFGPIDAFLKKSLGR